MNRWFGWLFSQDRRNAKREASLPLVAYYWDGAEPMAHGILDAGLSGVYILTKHRWYPGTVVTLTLQRVRAEANDPWRTISVNSKVVRSGSDGVGFQFLPNPPYPRESETSALRVADAEIMRRFFEQVESDRQLSA